MHVATINILQRDFPLRFAEAPPFGPDSWQRTQPPGEPRRRDTAGEYVPLAFLCDGRLAIVTRIQDPREAIRIFPAPCRPAEVTWYTSEYKESASVDTDVMSPTRPLSLITFFTA